TFFSTDPVARGCHDRLIVAGMDRPQGEVLPIPGNIYIARARKDQDARDQGQFGVALRWFVPELNDTEFGFYAMNYHMRTPNLSGIAGNFLTTFDPAQTVPGLDGTVGAGGYFFEYPEDVRLYGVSVLALFAGVPEAFKPSLRFVLPLLTAGCACSRTMLQLVRDNTHRVLVGLPSNSEIRSYERKEFYQAQVSSIKTI